MIKNQCAVHPYSTLFHLDSPCHCFFGGPAPEYVTTVPTYRFAA